MSEKKERIYCAGPLFSEEEKKEMASIARALEKAGYRTFIPQRDGLELAALQKSFAGMAVSGQETAILISRAIFALDVHEILASDGLVLNMNGRVPDEGAMVEAGIAWATERGSSSSKMTSGR